MHLELSCALPAPPPTPDHVTSFGALASCLAVSECKLSLSTPLTLGLKLYLLYVALLYIISLFLSLLVMLLSVAFSILLSCQEQWQG